MDEVQSNEVPALEMIGVCKAFAGRRVLNNVNLEVRRGEINALAGANGSGKSTMVKILAGYHQLDEGRILVGGTELLSRVRAHQVRQAGVRFVHQEKGFITGMSVLDNMCLGRGYTRGVAGRIKWRYERAAIGQALERHNVNVRLDSDSSALSVADRAKLAIIRAMHTREGEERRLIVLDEATAAMAGDEAAALGAWLRDLVNIEQLGVLFIGHRPSELRDVADRISVLRNGEIVATFEADRVTDQDIVEAIVGSPVGSFYPTLTDVAGEGSAKLEVEHISGDSVSDMSFSLQPGEIVGITGIEGSGFEEVPYLLFDPERSGSGSMTMNEETIQIGQRSIQSHLRNGLALVAADRARYGFVSNLTVRENVVQPRFSQFRDRGFLSFKRERDAAQRVVDDFGVLPAGTEVRLAQMSGGNQQKVVLGKWIATDPDVLLLHEPTEGIDVATKREIFRILSEQKKMQRAILIASIEYEDLAHVCDRILVCGGGRIYAELKGGDFTGADVMRAAYAASIDSKTGSDRAAW